MEATPVAINEWTDENEVVNIYEGLLLRQRTEWNLTSMECPTGYYAKQNKLVRERQIPYHLSFFMWNLKNNVNTAGVQSEIRTWT